MSQTTQEQIRLLKAIHRATCSSTGGSTSDATEATLQAILAELRDNNSLNEMLVTDTAGVVHIRRTTVNADTGAITTEYLDPQTQVVSVPTFPIVASSTDDWDTYELIPVFDNNGVTDNSNLTQIYAQYKTDKAGVITFVKYYKEDRTTVHTVVGTVYEDVGNDTQSNVVFFQLSDIAPNNTFITSGLMTSVTIDVVKVANIGTPPTITTRVDPSDPLTEIVKPLREGRAIILENEGTLRIVPGIIVTAQLGDIIDILYTVKIKM